VLFPADPTKVREAGKRAAELAWERLIDRPVRDPHRPGDAELGSGGRGLDHLAPGVLVYAPRGTRGTPGGTNESGPCGRPRNADLSPKPVPSKLRDPRPRHRVENAHADLQAFL
jgi:hypothetical protein